MNVRRYTTWIIVTVFLVHLLALSPWAALGAEAVFSVHPDNHRVFLYRGKPMKILTSAEHYGAVVNGDFDWDVYLKEMQRTGQNMTRVFAFYRETANGSPGDIRNVGKGNTLAPEPSAAVLPVRRVSGHGQALDGFDKFDLDISSKTNADGWWFEYNGPPKGRAGQIWPFLRQRDEHRKPIVFDETFSGIVRGEPERYAVNRAEAWEMLLSGGAGYNNLDWSFTPQDEAGSGQAPIGDGRRLDGRKLRKWFNILRTFLAEYDLSALSPVTGVLNEKIPGYGYAASMDDSGRYLLYLVDKQVYLLKPCEDRRLEISLSLPPGQYSVEMMNPSDGRRSPLPGIVSEGEPVAVSSNFCEDIALVLSR